MVTQTCSSTVKAIRYDIKMASIQEFQNYLCKRAVLYRKSTQCNQVTNLDFAPGEGKKPTSFLDLKHWDVKSWPMLLPDGKFGLDYERKVKLTRQNYFQQRLLNVLSRPGKTSCILLTYWNISLQYTTIQRFYYRPMSPK